MPKLLTKEELMLNITGIRYALRDDISARTGFEQVLSHIDALHERLEGIMHSEECYTGEKLRALLKEVKR